MQLDLSKPVKNIELQADIIYFFGLIEHVIEIDNLINNCENMLKPNGRIVIASSNALSPWYYGLRNFSRVGIHCTTDRYFSRYSIGKIMKKHGYEEINHKYWGFFPAGVEGYIYKFLYSVGTLIEKTPLRIFGGGMTICYKKA
jgi:SAM-dependent methyltransferase